MRSLKAISTARDIGRKLPIKDLANLHGEPWRFRSSQAIQIPLSACEQTPPDTELRDHEQQSGPNVRPDRSLKLLALRPTFFSIFLYPSRFARRIILIPPVVSPIFLGFPVSGAGKIVGFVLFAATPDRYHRTFTTSEPDLALRCAQQVAKSTFPCRGRRDGQSSKISLTLGTGLGISNHHFPHHHHILLSRINLSQTATRYFHCTRDEISPASCPLRWQVAAGEIFAVLDRDPSPLRSEGWVAEVVPASWGGATYSNRPFVQSRSLKSESFSGI